MLNFIKRFFLSILLFSLLNISLLVAQESAEVQHIPNITTSGSPQIPQLKSKDFIFMQYSEDLKQFYMDTAAGRETTLTFYSYTAGSDDTIFTIAARCNIPYDTISSLNQISSADVKLEGKTLLLPSAAGIFVLDNGTICQEKPKTSLEGLIQKKYNDELQENVYLYYNINGRYFVHLPQERLDQTTRAFFLDVKMKTPLDSYWLSSDFGYRQSPFGGEKQFHKGIDMAAPEGTKVYACKTGKVISVVKMDKTFGNYIVIKHVNGLSSIYAHLSKIEVNYGDEVVTGQQIGLVGKTGKVTGPHLHFEIRQNGQPTDPGSYIRSN